MHDINDQNNATRESLRDFGLATSRLLFQWLNDLPDEYLVAITNLLNNDGAQLGVRFLSATLTKQPSLAILMVDRAGEFHVVAETAFEQTGTLQ